MVSECGDAFAGSIGEEFKIIQGASAAGESIKIQVPIFLSLEAMSEMDVCMV